jgi:hypothetical protein
VGSRRSRQRGALAGTLLLVALLGLVGCGGSKRAAVTEAAVTVTVVRTVTVEAPPLTEAERRARQALVRAAAEAKKKAAAEAAARAARKAAAAAAAKARAKAAAEKAAAAAAAARKKEAAAVAANAWHKGYAQQDGNVYWEWRHAGICQASATDGCWHLAVITRKGCPSYIGVDANEYRGGAIVGKVHAEQIYGVPSKTVRVFELDADSHGPVTANDVEIVCR